MKVQFTYSREDIEQILLKHITDNNGIDLHPSSRDVPSVTAQWDDNHGIYISVSKGETSKSVHRGFFEDVRGEVERDS